jgi:Erv1 / Alr family
MVFMPRTIAQPRNNTDKPSIPQPTSSKNQTKTMIWGEPTWFLFHTLAEKVKEDCFEKVKIGLLNHIIAICGVLPCPICAQHASEYMRKVQINAIRSKKDLKDLLFNFHNEVNSRKGLSLFSRDDLDEKYSKANTANIIKYFISVIQQKSNNVTAIATDMYKMRIVQLFKVWLNTNIENFDM